MTEQQSSTKEASTKLGLTAEEAAGAAIAQSISLAAQNEVDALRNQNTVNMVAMGVAYAKWLQNPLLGQHYNEVVGTTRLSSIYHDSLFAKSFDNSFAESKSAERAEAQEEPLAQASATAASGKRAHSLPVKVFSHFLSPPKRSK